MKSHRGLRSLDAPSSFAMVPLHSLGCHSPLHKRKGRQREEEKERRRKGGRKMHQEASSIHMDSLGKNSQ